MTYVVLGAGMMGSAVAFDLARTEPDAEVVLADRDGALAQKNAFDRFAMYEHLAKPAEHHEAGATTPAPTPTGRSGRSRSSPAL